MTGFAVHVIQYLSIFIIFLTLTSRNEVQTPDIAHDNLNMVFLHSSAVPKEGSVKKKKSINQQLKLIA